MRINKPHFQLHDDDNDDDGDDNDDDTFLRRNKDANSILTGHDVKSYCQLRCSSTLLTVEREGERNFIISCHSIKKKKKIVVNWAAPRLC